jgi:hypothetical protein
LQEVTSEKQASCRATLASIISSQSAEILGTPLGARLLAWPPKKIDPQRKKRIIGNEKQSKWQSLHRRKLRAKGRKGEQCESLVTPQAKVESFDTHTHKHMWSSTLQLSYYSEYRHSTNDRDQTYATNKQLVCLNEPIHFSLPYDDATDGTAGAHAADASSAQTMRFNVHKQAREAGRKPAAVVLKPETLRS